MSLALRQSAYIKGGLINDFQLKLASQFYLNTNDDFSLSQRVLLRKEDMTKALSFNTQDLSVRVGLTGPLEQLTLSSYSTLVLLSHSLLEPVVPSRLTAHSFSPVYSLPAEPNPVSVPAQPNS